MKEAKPLYASVLDRIIEKYTALPREDPEWINYSDRPEQRSRRHAQPRRRHSIACRSRRAR